MLFILGEQFISQTFRLLGDDPDVVNEERACQIHAKKCQAKLDLTLARFTDGGNKASHFLASDGRSGGAQPPAGGLSLPNHDARGRSGGVD